MSSDATRCHAFSESRARTRSQSDKLADSSQPVILRIASASYLASFLVRDALLKIAAVVLIKLLCAVVLALQRRLARHFCRRHLCCSTWQLWAAGKLRIIVMRFAGRA